MFSYHCWTNSFMLKLVSHFLHLSTPFRTLLLWLQATLHHFRPFHHSTFLQHHFTALITIPHSFNVWQLLYTTSLLLHILPMPFHIAVKTPSSPSVTVLHFEALHNTSSSPLTHHTTNIHLDNGYSLQHPALHYRSSLCHSAPLRLLAHLHTIITIFTITTTATTHTHDACFATSSDPQYLTTPC